MNELTIGNHASWISFKVHNPTAAWQHQEDAYIFLGAEARMQINTYSAIEHGVFLADELIDFRNELKNLYKTLKGNATFSTLENWIRISITGNGMGHLELDCYLSSSDGNIRLEGKFNLDQTYLPNVLNQLDLIIEEMLEK